MQTEEDGGAPDYAQAAEAAYDWFTAHGAQFFFTRHGEPFLHFDNAIYWMDSADRGRKRQYSALLYKHTGLVPTSPGGRTFFEVLPSLALIRGQRREHFSWLHTDVPNQTVYFNLNNDQHEIAKITPDGVELLKNGGNPDGIILQDSQKMKPLRFLADADLAEADRLLTTLILNNLTCAPGERSLVLSWLSCFLLLDFAGTRPMTRFEGPAGSGKTTASKLISALLYGEPQQKKSTDAANYTDGSQNPLIVLDNIEVKQMTDELTTFMLTSITGIAKEKRKSGTDTETVIERTKCLLNTTGIEPLGGELAEILSRSFIVRFDLDEQASDCFLEATVLAAIGEHRALIVSALIRRTNPRTGDAPRRGTREGHAPAAPHPRQPRQTSLQRLSESDVSDVFGRGTGQHDRQSSCRTPPTVPRPGRLTQPGQHGNRPRIEPDRHRPRRAVQGLPPRP